MSDEERNSGEDAHPTVESSTVRDPLVEAPPELIGPYRLLQKLGEGGMGEVWLAEQQEPVRRMVALKVIKRGMDSKRVVARFEAERQALAMMDHPVVAKVFDAGATPRGRPFFVMEHVQGVPITKHCDRQKLGTRERLELFCRVCEGVQHAHQKAIIHRDLKPSNILVSIQDERALPKIIDFGLAKAMAQKLTERTMFTELGVMIGTPEYMSPEQAERTGQDVDTRADVYSLGVILYELLVGALPFDPKELRSGGYSGIISMIRETEPSRPSQRLSTLGEASEESAERRRTDRSSLQRQLRGDLDWITMKALEKDRTRRYGSPTELADDIRRYLNDEPVLASPPSTVYRAAKFVRRHRLGVSAAAAVLVVLVAGIVTSTVLGLREAHQRQAAEEARRNLEAVADFQNEMLAGLDPAATGESVIAALRGGIADALRHGGRTTGEIDAALAGFESAVRSANPPDVARSVLDASILSPAAEAIESQFGDQPYVQARLLDTLARTYANLGMYDRAEPHAARALEVIEPELGPEHRDTLNAMNGLASVRWQQGRYDEAETLFLETLARQRRALGERDRATLITISNLGGIYYRQARYADAESAFSEAFEAQREVLGEEHEDTLQAMNGLAATYLEMQRHDEALELYETGLATRRRVLGDEHPETLATLNNLAVLYDRLERHDDAEPLYLEALQTNRRLRGEAHPRTLIVMNSLSGLYRDTGRFEEAERMIRQAVEVGRRVRGAAHPRTRSAMNNLAVTLIEIGKPAAAREVLEELLSVHDPQDPDYGLHLHTYGELLLSTGELDGARSTLEQVVEIYGGQESARYLDLALHQLATVALQQGRRDDALDRLEQAVAAGRPPSKLAEDPELAPLRGDARFEALAAAGG